MNGKITARQAICTLYLYELGSSLVTGSSEKAGQDSWIAVIIGLAFAIPMIALYSKLSEIEPEMDFFEMCEAAFGKIGGRIATFLFSAYALLLGALVVRDFTEYLQVLSLPETPQPVIAVCMGLLGWYGIRKGISVPARNASFIAPLGTLVIFVLFALSVKLMNFDNLKPFLEHDTKTLLQAGYTSFVFPFAESALFLAIFCDADSSVSRKKLYLWGIIPAGTILTMLVVGNTAVLGDFLAKSMYFPSYESISVVDLGKFLSRFEVLVSGNFMIFGLLKSMICLYVASRGFVHLTGWQCKWLLISAAVSAGTVALSQTIYDSTMQMVSALKYYYRYAPLVEVVLPLLVFLTLSAKKALSRRRQAPTPEENA